ncbi:hypothetical protein MUK42_31148, partial [Musa troglodytarum]
MLHHYEETIWEFVGPSSTLRRRSVTEHNIDGVKRLT